jgi:HAD superfamily hydrolase (TIGR01509 family)
VNPKFDAVLFDCDGVLADSESIVTGVLREMLNEAGWALSQAECEHIFIGKAVRDERARIEAETGQPLTEAWMQTFYARRNQRLQHQLTLVPGADAAVAAAHALTGGRIACASGADRHKVEMQLQQLGLHQWFGTHIHSGHEQAANKPAPDVYLAAAAGLGVAPERCLVIEDTPTGARAGLAAGATVWGLLHQRADVFAGLAVARTWGSMGEVAAELQRLSVPLRAVP